MKITYSAKGMPASDSLSARLEKKLGKLDRYFRNDAEASVSMRQQKAGQNVCEITVASGGLLLRAEESSNDMYLSIDRAVDKLESQIRRHRTKLEKRLHIPAPEIPAEEPAFEEPSYSVVRVKKFAVQPMTVEDAVQQMDLLGHSFFLFSNEETGIMSVVYRRNDGDIGLLQPE